MRFRRNSNANMAKKRWMSVQSFSNFAPASTPIVKKATLVSMDDLVPEDSSMDNVHMPGGKYITVIPVQYPRQQSMPGNLDYEEGDAGQPFRYNSNRKHAMSRHAIPESVGDLTMCGQSLASISTQCPVMDICVFMMNKVGIGLEVENGQSATAKELTSMLIEEEEVDLPSQAEEVFSLWMTSPLLEIQLKPHHKPFRIRNNWRHLTTKYCHASQIKIQSDEPVLSFQRNVFFPRKDELKIKDGKVLGLLFEEAKSNILDGRYPCEMSDYEMLAGIQARLETGPYNPKIHTLQFFRDRLGRYMPKHSISRKTPLSFLSRVGKTGPEARILDQFRSIPLHTNTYKLVRRYMEYCWALPFYGSAYFRGQIERNMKGLSVLLSRSDVPVWIAINRRGVHIIEVSNCEILLGVKYKEMSWDYAKPSQPNNADCLPCLFLQFQTFERGRRFSKILQIFSKQAVMMDALISTFVQEQKQRHASIDELDSGNLPPSPNCMLDEDDVNVPLTTTLSRRQVPQSCLSNKLSKLSLATFNERGQCIGHNGSLSFGS